MHEHSANHDNFASIEQVFEDYLKLAQMPLPEWMIGGLNVNRSSP